MHIYSVVSVTSNHVTVHISLPNCMYNLILTCLLEIKHGSSKVPRTDSMYLVRFTIYYIRCVTCRSTVPAMIRSISSVITVYTFWQQGRHRCAHESERRPPQTVFWYEYIYEYHAGTVYYSGAATFVAGSSADSDFVRVLAEPYGRHLW